MTILHPREHLVRALEADLVGPFDLDTPDAREELKLPPSRWYLTGFLAPQEGREADVDPTDDEGFTAGDDEDEEDSQQEEPESGRKHWLPASMGITVLLPPGGASTLTATVRFAE